MWKLILSVLMLLVIVLGVQAQSQQGGGGSVLGITTNISTGITTDAPLSMGFVETIGRNGSGTLNVLVTFGGMTNSFNGLTSGPSGFGRRNYRARSPLIHGCRWSIHGVFDDFGNYALSVTCSNTLTDEYTTGTLSEDGQHPVGSLSTHGPAGVFGAN